MRLTIIIKNLDSKFADIYTNVDVCTWLEIVSQLTIRTDISTSAYKTTSHILVRLDQKWNITAAYKLGQLNNLFLF